MYLYNSMDRTFVASRVSEFRAQVKRRLAGELAEEEFPLAAPERLTARGMPTCCGSGCLTDC